MDTLKLIGLRYRVKLGFLPEERVLGGEVRIDIALHGDFRKAGASDDIADAIDYRMVVQTITAEVATHSFHLIEAFAERTATQLFEAISVINEVEITVRKLQPPLPVIMDGVEVTIHRSRQP
ncbi:MAG: dihydroneopterin aldolase [bacterium]|nr:dihydroneopterin aldolase [bacterium]